MTMSEVRSRTGALAAALICLATAAAAQDAPVPRILLDQSPRAIEYQLGRLTDEQLVRVERLASDARYVPIYYALLTRASMPDAVREEALVALAGLQNTTRTGVLLEGLAQSADVATASPLLRLLLVQSPVDLVAERERLDTAVTGSDAQPFVLQGGYVARMVADRSADAAWAAAGEREGHRAQLLRGLSFLPSSPAADALRRSLAPRVAALVAAPPSDDEYVAAVGAVTAVSRDAAAFSLLAGEVTRARSPESVAVAIDGLALIPESAWPADVIEPLVRTIIARVTALSPDVRTEREPIDAIGLADRLAGALPAARARVLRSDLRALGVRVVRLEARPEQVAFDLRWFVVEAGRPVQIVFFNPDAMPHNVVIGVPGSLQMLGEQGGAMPMPSDPAAKPFVPDVPQVIAATPLVTQGNTSRLGFIAPATPGEYVFVCTFPGHWVRMYGVMLVVPSLDAWEAKPSVPTDPMTKQPFM
jgi:hypothetical protein